MSMCLVSHMETEGIHVFNRDNRLTSGLMLVFDLPGLSRSSTISLMACSILSLREEEEVREEEEEEVREEEEAERRRRPERRRREIYYTHNALPL